MENKVVDLFEVRQDLYQASRELFSLSHVIAKIGDADETVREGLGFLIQTVSEKISGISDALPAE